MRKLLPAVAFIACLGIFFQCGNASADAIMQLTETFQSGAVFSGQLDFSDGYTNLLAVNGNLTGFFLGDFAITFVYSQVSGVQSTNDGSTISDFILANSVGYFPAIAIDWTNTGGSFALANGQLGNGIMLVGDEMVSYSATPESPPIPEPCTMLLFGAGLLGFGGFRLRKELRG